MNVIEERGRIQSYFDGQGFERLSAIYGEEKCRGFRAVVRQGHTEVVRTIVSWLSTDKPLDGQSVLDAGCGAGALSVPLAAAGARVEGVDFSSRMIDAARDRAAARGVPAERLRFTACDFLSVTSVYDVVVCVDVLARYSPQAPAGLLAHLSGRAVSRLILTYAPKGLLDRLWLAIGNRFAKRSGAARLYTHRDSDIANLLHSSGWTIRRRHRVSAGFRSYFCCMVECRRNSLDTDTGEGFQEVWY